jgi:hypothetical protein
MPLFTRARRDAALELAVTGYDGLVSQWKNTARIPVPIQAVGVIK